jgi:DNA repair exonuclease SbcCD ATPase subunit
MNLRARLAGLALLGSVTLTFGQIARADRIVRWTDEHGRLHFSNLAPAEETPAEEHPAPELSREAAPVVTGTPLPHANLSDEAFSTEASRTRAKLKRDLADAERRVRELDEKIADLRQKRAAAIQDAITRLGSVSAPEDVPSQQELELQKEKEAVEKRIEEVRKRYAELHDEAVARRGGEPPWWLPLD